MQSTAIDSIAMWSQWDPERRCSTNAFFIAHDEGNIAIDPLSLPEHDADEIAQRGGLAWVVVTNGADMREALAVAERFGAKVATGRDGFSPGVLHVDRRLGPGDTLGPLRTIGVDGVRGAEIALALGWHTIVAGQVLRGAPVGSLQLAPDDALQDPQAAARSLRSLRSTRPRNVLVTVGAPIFGNGYEALSAALEARTDVAANVVNFDELEYLPESIEAPGYGSMSAEVGYLLGAKILGYQTARVPPGQSICPLHWHAGDEELFVVWEGSPTLISPRGETQLRRGDIACFVTGASGAHKLVNRGSETVIVLMIANDAPVDACFYPDSKKVLVSPAGVMVRSEPRLEYFDFEPLVDETP